jgi:PKD repeat protein
MRGKFVSYILFIICLLPNISMGQTDPCHKTTEGTDFWFAFMESRNYHVNTHNVEVTLTSPFTCQYKLTIGKSNTIIQSGTVFPDTPVRYTLDWKLVEATGSETIQERAIHLTSDNPMNVYALNYDKNSADVALIFPTDALGNEYYAACYTPHVKEDAQGNYSDGRNSEFLVVATEDNTTVTIVPTKVTDKLQPANVPFTVILSKGEVYQVQSMNHNNLANQGDLTGSYAGSNKPVAFFSGSLSTTVGTGTNDCCWDHLYEQIPPVQAWGSRFMAVPLKSRQKDTYRVLAAYDNTVVLVGNNPGFALKKGEYKEFSLDYNDPRIIESSKPILLVQYSNSQSVDASYTGNNGDPFMIIVSPLIQTKQNVTFVAYNSTQITNRYFVNVIAKDDAVSFITLDQKPVLFTSLPNSGYSYAQVSITQGNHKLETSLPDKGFIAYVYGFGGVESYGYGVGFNLDIQLDLGSNFGLKDTLVICQGTEAKLEAGAYFDTYLWNTGETKPFIIVSKEGMYKITASTILGCEKSDNLYIKVSDPKIDLGVDKSSCDPGKIVLDAGKDFKTYLWQDGSTSQKFTVLKTGDYSVTGTNEFDCQTTDVVHVDVFQVPEVKIVGEVLHCGVFTADFTADLKVDVANADAALWNYPGAAIWTSSPTGLELKDKRPNGVKLNALNPGYYTVNYTLTTKDSCAVSDTFHVGFYKTPESTFEVTSPLSTDKCSSYERIVKYTGKSGPTAKFNWDFGGLMVLDTIAPNHFKVSIGANNPLRTITLFVEEHGCTSPLTSRSIGVIPTFSFGADKVHGCDALCVQFNSEVTIMDKVSYRWTFGDGAVSDFQNPLHCYTDTGKYDVSLMVTNVIDGCRNGSIEPEMIKIYKTPVAKLSADAEFCYGDTAKFEYLNKKDVSNCEWFTKGNELISKENTAATYLLKNEISTVGFIVEENGCKCDTFKVEVKRKPNFDFEALEPEICLPFQAKLKAIPKDPNLDFSWSLDSLSEMKGDSLNHLFHRSGYYTVKLEAFSALTGCSDVLIKSDFIHVYPLPLPAFSQNYKVATLEHPDISFSNQTEGAVSYLWDFGDGTTSEEKNPLHKYTEIGEYQVVMQAATDFGCTDTITSRVKIIPFSFFTPNAFRPDSELPENRIFQPIKEGIDPENYQFQIFNRVGSTVFETKNPGIGWDGKMPNGTSAEPGVFVWIVKYSDIQGYGHLQKGTVMLVR